MFLLDVSVKDNHMENRKEKEMKMEDQSRKSNILLMIV